MAEKTFPASWIGIYTSSPNKYHSTNTPIQCGGSSGFNTLIGIPPSVKDAINTSKTPPKLLIRFNCTKSGVMDLGGHKETYNKARGTLPWYKYLRRSFSPAVGWREYDITTQFVEEYKKGSLNGIVLYGAAGASHATAYGRTSNSNEFLFVVEGLWNEPPSKPPSVTSPTASTVASQSVLVQWSPSVDDETPQEELRYEISYYNGSSWLNPIMTGKGVTEYNFSLASQPETSRAQFRVRAYDGELYSEWAYSPLFTVTHNLPPARPMNLYPSGGRVVDRTKVIRASWRHNDDGPQAGYRLQWRTVDGSERGEWNYIPSIDGWVNSTLQQHDFSPDIFPLGEIEWTLKTKDQQGEESPLASYERFIAGEPSDAPIWLFPTSGGTVNHSDIIAEWSSLDQIQYEIFLEGGDTLLWSEMSASSAKKVQVGYSLENNTEYTLRLRVLNEQSGLWSDWSTIHFITQFIPPAKPLIEVVTTDEEGNKQDTVTIRWITDEPATETLTEYVQVFRRVFSSSIEHEWELVGDNQAPNSSMIDYTPASNRTYEYKVRAWGENDTFADSDIVEVEVVLERSFLHRAAVPSDLLVFDATERESTYDLMGELMHFANREKPIFEHSIHEEHRVNISWVIDTPEELRNVYNFVSSKETFLYRDNNGRKMFCVVRSPRISDKVAGGFDFSLDLVEVDGG